MLCAVALATTQRAGAQSSGGAPAGHDSGDVARAEALFTEATKLMEAGQYREACPKLADSQRIVRGIGVTLYLAECYERTGKTASAWAQFRLAESLASARGDKRAGIAHERAERLEPNLPHVRIVVAPEAASVPGFQVVQDGSVVDRPAWGVEVPIDPGPHTFVARAPQKADWSTDVSVAAVRATTTVSIPALADATTGTGGTVGETGSGGGTTPPVGAGGAGPGPTPEGDAGMGNTQRLVGLVVAGVGVVGLGVGTVFGLSAKSKYNDSDAHCNANDQCDATGLGLRSDGMTAATVSTLAFGVGAAALVGGAVLYFTAPRGARTTALLPAIGPQGASLSLRGSF